MCVLQRLPFRREPGKRVVGGLLQIRRIVDQDGDRRLEFFVTQALEYIFGVLGGFDQDSVRLQFFERQLEAAGRTRSVVSYAEDVVDGGGLLLKVSGNMGSANLWEK